MTPEAFRSRFPALAGRVYLNTASEGAMPADAAREGERTARIKETPWEIGAEAYYELPAAVRAHLETLIGAPAGTVALVAGTSAGIGLAARQLPLSAGEEVLLLDASFPSNLFPWRAVVSRGANLRIVARPFGTDPTAALLEALGPATRVVSVDWVNYVDGAVVDLHAVGAACRKRGIRFVVDAAQGLGALPIDVVEAQIDILAAPSHKWLLGPTGGGFVYVRADLLETLQPWNAGWVNLAARSGFRNLLRLDGSPPEDATRLETGTPPNAILAPWKLSLDLLAEAGKSFVYGRVRALSALLRGAVQGMASGGLSLVSPTSGDAAESGITAIGAGDRAIALYRHLEREGITTALREGAVRISPHAYNTEEEIARLRRALDRFVGGS